MLQDVYVCVCVKDESRQTGLVSHRVASHLVTVDSQSQQTLVCPILSPIFPPFRAQTLPRIPCLAPREHTHTPTPYIRGYAVAYKTGRAKGAEKHSQLAGGSNDSSKGAADSRIS